MRPHLGQVVYRFVAPDGGRSVEFYQRGLGALRFRERVREAGSAGADGRPGPVSAAFRASHDSAMTETLVALPWLHDVAARVAEASAYVDGLLAVETSSRQTPFDAAGAVADGGSARLVWLTNRERGRVSRLLRGERDVLLAACSATPVGYDQPVAPREAPRPPPADAAARGGRGNRGEGRRRAPAGEHRHGAPDGALGRTGARGSSRADAAPIRPPQRRQCPR